MDDRVNGYVELSESFSAIQVVAQSDKNKFWQSLRLRIVTLNEEDVSAIADDMNFPN